MILVYQGHTGDARYGSQISQEYNHEYTTTYEGEKVWNHSTDTLKYTNYTFTFSASNYSTISSKCAPTGGTAYLNLAASHLVETWADYTRTDTVVHTFESGYSYNSYPVVNGNDIYDASYVNDVSAGNTSVTTQVYSSGFTLSGMTVTVDNMHTTPYPTVYVAGTAYGRSATYRATLTKQDGTTETKDVTLYQAVNKVESRVPELSEKYYGSPSTDTENGSYYAHIYSSKYGPGNTACPASGNGENGENILTLAAGHQTRTKTTTPWTRYYRELLTWSTNETSYTDWDFYDSDNDVSYGNWTDVADNYTVSVTQPATGDPFIINGTNVTIPSEGTTYLPNGRSATITISNNAKAGVTDSIVLSQAANYRTVTYSYSLYVSIGQSGTLSYLQGIYDVSYTSKRTPITSYSSGVPPEVGTTENTYSAISVSPDTVEPSTQRVSGQGTFTITVPENTVQTERTITVTLTAEADSSQTYSDSRQQGPAPAIIAATLTPWISPDNTSPYRTGLIYVKFHVTQGTLPTTTIGGVVLHTKTSANGSEMLTQIGDLSVTNDETPMPRLKDANGRNVMGFSGDYGEAWFTVSSTGGVDNLTLAKSTYQPLSPDE